MAVSAAAPDARRVQHAPETAGRLMVTRVYRAAAQEVAGAVLDRLAREDDGAPPAVYVLAADGRLLGACSLRRLIAAARDDPLLAHVQPVPQVAPDTDQERVASVALETGVVAVPVVDDAGRLLGVVTTATLLEVLRREHVEDLHRLAGIAREGERARHALEDPPLRRARHRLPWLLVGLGGTALATAVMAAFEASLQARVAVAFFVPGIVYLADAIGTQSEAVAVRGLSLTRVPLGRLLGGELRTGLLIGAVLGVITLPAVGIVFGDWRLALAVTLAVLGAGTAATTIGLALPWLIQRLGADPAFGSGPLATVIQDVLSLLIYLLLASWLAA